MAIKKRRAASSETSREKKLGGHQNEHDYADLIGGERIKGTQKGDVEDLNGNLHSVKSGKKWQIFLYSYDRILESKHLKILSPCLDAFTIDSEKYFTDRELCLEFKESYIKKHGRSKAKVLPNSEIKDRFKENSYVDAKDRLSIATQSVCENLISKKALRNFLGEAIFNGVEVKFLAIKDDTLRCDGVFRVYEREQVLKILTEELFPLVSNAGKVPEDYNVAGQKTRLCYKTEQGADRNIVEIEIRNDSPVHYREVRFNMKSKDTLKLLKKHIDDRTAKKIGQNVLALGNAATGKYFD